MQFDPQQLAILTGPGVYVFYCDSTILYVGATKHGLGRCFSCTHRMAEFFKTGVLNLEFIPMSTEVEAFKLEEELILEYNPEFNRNQKDGYRRYRMKRRAIKPAKTKQGILDEATVERLKSMTRTNWPEYLRHYKDRDY